MGATAKELKAPRAAGHNGACPDTDHGADYPAQLASGSTVFIVSEGQEEPAYVATLIRVAPGLYQLGDISGRSNQMVPRQAVDGLREALRTAGVVMPPQHVSWSLDWMAKPERGGGRRMGAALRDPFDDDDEDFAA